MKLIENEKEHKIAIKRLEYLLRVSPSAHEIGILALVIEDYEKKRFPINNPTPLAAVKFRMEQKGLKATDLVKMGVFATRSRASEFLSGKRQPSLSQRRAMKIKLGIPTECLI